MARPRRSAAASTRKIKGLIYGPPKHGKTHFLGTAAFDERTAPFLCLDFEGGVEDVLETMPGWGTDFVNHRVRTWDDFNVGYERIRSNDEGFKGVGIDSISETGIFALMDILDNEGATRKDPDMLQQGDYGKALVQLRRLVRHFRDLPVHTFYTAHHKEEADVREGLVKMPNMSGKAAIEIPGMMSVVGYLALTTDEAGDTIRSLLLQNHARIRTGVRAPWGIEIPDEIDDPTVTELLDVLQYK